MKYAIGKPFVAAGGDGGAFLIPSSVSSADSGQVIAGWPLTNVRDEHLRRSVRFNDGANRIITFNVSSTQPAAVFVEGVNVSSVIINGVTLTCERSPRTGRYSRYHEPSSGSSATWSVTLVNASKIVAAHTYLECGRIVMVKSGSLNTMPANCWGQPFGGAVDSLGDERTLPSGETETGSTSENFFSLDLQGVFKLADPTVTVHPMAFASMRRDERVLLFEDYAGDTNKVRTHLLRRVGETSVLETFPDLDVAVSMRESI